MSEKIFIFFPVKLILREYLFVLEKWFVWNMTATFYRGKSDSLGCTVVKETVSQI